MSKINEQKTKSDFELLFDATETIEAKQGIIDHLEEMLELSFDKYNNLKEQNGFLILAADKYKSAAAWSWLTTAISVIITIVVVIANN